MDFWNIKCLSISLDNNLYNLNIKQYQTTMQKVLAISAIATAVACNAYVPPNVAAPLTASWPVLDLYTTFKTDASLFTWNGSKLSPYKDITATIKVDSDRNKIKADAKVSIPLVGKINAEVLADLTQGVVYEYVPFLGLCQKTPLNMTVQLKDVLSKIYSPDGGVTIFDGESQAPWDKTTMYKFHGSGPDAVVTAFFDENTKNGKWISEVPTDTKNPSLVASIPNGEQKASFTDADFQIKGCASFTEENPVNIWV